jgi:hypothetical protein
VQEKWKDKRPDGQTGRARSYILPSLPPPEVGRHRPLHVPQLRFGIGCIHLLWLFKQNVPQPLFNIGCIHPLLLFEQRYIPFSLPALGAYISFFHTFANVP